MSPQDIVCWMNVKTFGKENPLPDSANPLYARSLPLEILEKNTFFLYAKLFATVEYNQQLRKPNNKHQCEQPNQESKE